ncbi:succinyl-diaminopimelate desuccinylase [Kaistia dalseonensis]|uniref:Succinyl-diaminopimelate desuccinylase n=1 Tax=Kaistia dalseonensis TaxID=410840 RepID=A0ABU0H9G4_9HYPH|nr:succinyl-diaminopimelate desuccinylase [Kaistia dalseonensis]MCX5496344.1 succinyl-diaminopimelate desuccinylase [Kaistia dalseonensis]MDQ0438964.1 succinyl-diaminopimelate desuccinylase [Kaistia dalseonensis]
MSSHDSIPSPSASTTPDATTLLQGLVRCPSVTPAEAGSLAFLESVLAPAGFAVSRPVFSEPGTPDVENLFATIGSGAPHFVFAGHTDVVPPGDPARWSHGPFEGAIEHGMLYGRGAVDMKGGIAAFVAAALGYLAEKPDHRGTISLLITGDEEGPSINGTVKLLEWAAQRGHRFDAAIVGEPTNPNALGDAIKVGRRGSLSGTIIVTGTQGHVAYPHLAVNPIPQLMKLIRRLTAEALDHGNERFDASNLEFIGLEVDNKAWNVIPAEAKARFNIRFNDEWTPETLEAWLMARLEEAAGNEIEFELVMEPTKSTSFLTHSPALIDTLANAIETVTGRRPALSTSGGTSDARFVKDYCPVVEFGLVGQTMHQIDERVAIADLDALTAIYRRFLNDFIG